MACLELCSQNLNGAVLHGFISSACKVKGYKPVKGGADRLTVRAPDLPVLDAYELTGLLPMEIETDRSVDIGRFVELVEELGDMVVSAISLLSIAESGSEFDPSEESDVDLDFGVRSVHPQGVFAGGEEDVPLAPFVLFGIGGISPGSSDLAYRRDLFARLFAALGLKDRLEVFLQEGDLDLKTLTPEFQNVKDFKGQNLAPILDSGKRLFEKNYANPEGRNFGSLRLYCQTLEELAGKMPGVIDMFGGIERVVRCEYSFMCAKERYPDVRAILNSSPFSPWRLSFSAVSRYTLENLDQAVAENESFMIRAFTMKPKGIGEVDVDLYYREGSFLLSFACEYKSNKQEKALIELITELAGGEDILDHSLL